MCWPCHERTMNTNPEHLLNSSFREAAKDYLFFLEKGYPQKLVHKMVGDRYALSAIQRSMLYRGLSPSEISLRRHGKLADPPSASKAHIHIDTYNALLTIGSYLSGRVVFISTDGILRDAAEIHGKTLKPEIIERALSLSISFLEMVGPSTVTFYVDEQVNSSRNLFEMILESLNDRGSDGHAILSPLVDSLLSEVKSGMVASSDSTVIDRSRVPVLDLPRHILSHRFHPSFIDLGLIL